MPGRPRHKSPRRPQWLSPQRWGRFFAARRCEIGQSFGVWINLQRGYCNILGIGWAESEARLSIAFDEDISKPGAKVREELVVVMPHRAAKMLAQSLSWIISNYEANNGPIPVPADKMQEIEVEIKAQASRGRSPPEK